jgi:hypothetical protein
MTTWFRKCIVTELSEGVFTECMLTCPEGRNKLRDTGYNCYTSNHVPNKFDVGLNTSKASTHDILSSPVKKLYLIGVYEVCYLWLLKCGLHPAVKS